MDCRYNNWRYLFPIKVRRYREDRGSYRESGVGGEDGVAVAEDDDVSAPHPEDLQHGDITLGREAGTLVQPCQQILACGGVTGGGMVMVLRRYQHF